MVGIGRRDRRRDQRSEERLRERDRRLVRDNGCLLYGLVALGILLLLSLMFGGFHKGTPFKGSLGPTTVGTAASPFAPI